MTKDLTVGSPFKLVFQFALPLLFGLLFQQFYNVVDTMIVGQTLGPDALAAVGSTGAINFLVIGFCIGICNGFAIPIAQQFGAKNEVNVRKYVANAAWLCCVFAIILTILTCVLCNWILTIMKTPDLIFDSAYIYIFIIFAGIPATFLYNMVSGIIRSLGDSKTPVVFLVLSSVLNIILDFVLICFAKMGVAGAAVATVVSQAIAGVGCLIYMIKKFESLKMQDDEWKLDKHFALVLCGMGIPMGLQYSITAIGSVILQAAVNTLDPVYISSIAAATKLSCFFACPFDALGSTVATFGGQNVGAGEPERVHKGLKAAVFFGLVYSILALVIYFICADYLALLFVKAKEVEIIKNVRVFLMWNGAFYFPLALVCIVRFMIQGMGYSQLAVFAGVFEMIARTLVAIIFVPRFGYVAACLASPVAWIFADAFLIPAYYHCLGKLRKMFPKSQQAVS